MESKKACVGCGGALKRYAKFCGQCGVKNELASQVRRPAWPALLGLTVVSSLVFLVYIIQPSLSNNQASGAKASPPSDSYSDSSSSIPIGSDPLPNGLHSGSSGLTDNASDSGSSDSGQNQDPSSDYILPPANQGSSNGDTGSQPVNSTTDTSWIPAGFSQDSDNATIAWTWGAQGDCSIDTGSGSLGCVSMNVVSKLGCSFSFSGSITLLDSSGSEINTTDATPVWTTPALQQRKLVFQIYDSETKQGRFRSLYCY
jgi:hypothetical protein